MHAFSGGVTVDILIPDSRPGPDAAAFLENTLIPKVRSDLHQFPFSVAGNFNFFKSKVQRGWVWGLELIPVPQFTQH